MQLLLFAPASSSRLQYTCQFIFEEIMLLDFLITTDREAFKKYDGTKINYANEGTADDHLAIGNCGLLFENDIHVLDTSCFDEGGFKTFFRTENADLSFDIFSATFYLLSRYEEYLPHEKDVYGRYAHENSLAFRENFLQLPLINTWINHLVQILKQKFSGFTITRSPFSFTPTYDIDMAFSFKHKGWLRNIGGFLRAPSFNRLMVLAGLNKDPFDSYDWLNQLHNRYRLQPLYFFLLSEKNGKYDKNILPHKKAMRELVKQHATTYAIGIHPSWQSGGHTGALSNEIQCLSAITGKPVTGSRQHYISFNLPEGYRRLQASGITDDYSMGYGSINGFRASVASSFYWFDLEKNETSLLRVHPFCFMDANSFYEQKCTASEAYEELMRYFSICKEVNCQLVTIWHNNFLGADPHFAGWKEIYERFIGCVRD